MSWPTTEKTPTKRESFLKTTIAEGTSNNVFFASSDNFRFEFQNTSSATGSGLIFLNPPSSWTNFDVLVDHRYGGTLEIGGSHRTSADRFQIIGLYWYVANDRCEIDITNCVTGRRIKLSAKFWATSDTAGVTRGVTAEMVEYV